MKIIDNIRLMIRYFEISFIFGYGLADHARPIKFEELHFLLLYFIYKLKY